MPKKSQKNNLCFRRLYIFHRIHLQMSKYLILFLTLCFEIRCHHKKVKIEEWPYMARVQWKRSSNGDSVHTAVLLSEIHLVVKRSQVPNDIEDLEPVVLVGDDLLIEGEEMKIKMIRKESRLAFITLTAKVKNTARVYSAERMTSRIQPGIFSLFNHLLYTNTLRFVTIC